MLVLDQIDLVVADMDASLAFFRALGVDIPDSALWRTTTGIHHVDVTLEGGVILHLDSEPLARAYDAGWRRSTDAAGRVVLNFKVASSSDVDALHDRMKRGGYVSAQAPYDAFWGSRYAIVDDPDGNPVGIMGPPDAALRRSPPDL